MGRTAHRLCRRAAGVLRDLSDWLIARAEGLEKAGSYERRRPLRFENAFEATMRKMSERMLERYIEDLLAIRPGEPEWVGFKVPAMYSDQTNVANRIIPIEQPSSEEMRRSLKAYRYDV